MSLYQTSFMKYPGIYLMTIMLLLSVISCNNDTAEMDDRLKDGRDLFVSHCANCHKATEDYVAPALAQCRKREPDEDWAYRFVDSVNSMLFTDPYAISLHTKYGGLTMVQFDLSKDQVKEILDYCDSSVIYNQSNTTP